jgi:hypothetical protein
MSSPPAFLNLEDRRHPARPQICRSKSVHGVFGLRL